MFNPVRAPLDGYYPSERDQDGAFAWMAGLNNGGILPESQSEIENGTSFHTDEGKRVGPFRRINTSFPWSFDTGSWGGGLNTPNNFNTGNSTGIGALLAGQDHNTMFQDQFIESWTWAGVLKHLFFPDIWNRQVFILQRQGVFFPFNQIVINQRNDFGFRVQLQAAAFNLSVPIVVDASNDTSRGSRFVVTYEPGTLMIYQEGVEVASGAFNAFPLEVGEPFQSTRILWGGGNKSLDSFSGFFGGSCFMDRCWTPHQVAAWSADPWGQYRPMRRNVVQVVVPFCMDGSIGTRQVLDADVSTDLALDADLSTTTVLDADLDSELVLEGDVESRLTLDADLRTCAKDGKP